MEDETSRTSGIASATVQGSNAACRVCRAAAPAGANFCPQCGRKLRELPVSTSAARQAVVYAVSFFLAPFGLHFALQYIRQTDRKARMIGVISLALTIAAITLMFVIAKLAFDTLYGSYTSLLQ